MRRILTLAIVTVSLMRLHLAVTRYFDPDEFAHLHWTWLIANGQQPYRDFFFYIMPGFAWALSPILWLTGDSPHFLIASRVFLFLVYGLVAAMVYRLSHGSLLAALIFLTFPMTIDKSLDVRPDMVMLLLYFGSMMVKDPLLSGILFGLSFLAFPKIIFALPALIYIRSHPAVLQGVTLRKWITGTALVGAGFIAYLWVNNLIPVAYTSITKDSFAVTSGKISFSPLLLLSPYPLIYLTQGGVSLPWAVNTAVWILGIVGLGLLWKDHRRMAIFWGLFVAGNILFILLFPVPYVQYFLPLAVGASVLAGNALRKNITVINIIIVITVISSFFLQYRQRTAPGAGNTEQLQVIRDLLTISKPTDTFYDMVGSYVFRPDGYSICCHPYGEFVDKLTSPPPTLRQSLVAKNTRYIILDRTGQSLWKPKKDDLEFLRKYFAPSPYPKIYIRTF